MSGAPVVHVSTDKAEYQQGEPVVVTFSVDADTYDVPTPRTITYVGHDDEGNQVSGQITVVTHVPTADSFTLDSVKWQGGAPFDVVGLVATGTA